jgi:hypothetical protein
MHQIHLNGAFIPLCLITPKLAKPMLSANGAIHRNHPIMDPFPYRILMAT